MCDVHESSLRHPDAAKRFAAWAARNRSSIFFCAVVGTLATYLRFKALGFQSLWYDELVVLHFSSWRFSFIDLIRFCVGVENNPPLYFIVVKVWQSIAGPGEALGRVPCAVFGVMGVLSLYFLGRELFSVQTGALAAILCAVLPYHIQYSQETRAYTLAFLLAILSYLFYARTLVGRRKRDKWLYALFTALLLYTHYFGVMLLFSQGVFFAFYLFSRPDPKRAAGLARRAATLRDIAISWVTIAVAYAPWMPALLRIGRQRGFWIGRPKSDFFVDFFREYLAQEPYLVFGFCLLIASYLIGGGKGKARFRDHRLLLFCWAFSTLAAPYIRSLVSQPGLIARYAIVMLPSLLLMAGHGLANLSNASFRRFFLATLVFMSLVNLHFYKGGYYRRVTKKQCRDAVRYVIRNNPERAYPVLGDFILDYYFQEIFGTDIGVEPGISTVDEARALCDRLASQTSPACWVIEKHDAMDKAAREYLDSHLKKIKDRSWRATRATLYSNAPPLPPPESRDALP